MVISAEFEFGGSGMGKTSRYFHAKLSYELAKDHHFQRYRM